VLSGFCLLGILCFFLQARPPDHCLASAHAFSKISSLRCTRGLGSGIARASARSEYPSYSTPKASGSSAASFAHSTAFSFPGTLLCAEHHLISNLDGDVGAFFFLFIHYSHATYGDHGEDMYSPFPVRSPRSGGSLQAPLLPSVQACPNEK